MDFYQYIYKSPLRKKIDAKLYEVITQNTSNAKLRENTLYHLNCSPQNVANFSHSKRFRTFLCIIFGQEAGHTIDEILPLSICIELIHNSTLIIDDIQDDDEIRCDKPSLWKKVGIAEAVNAAYHLNLIALSYFSMQKVKHNYYDYSELFLNEFDKLCSSQQSDIDKSGFTSEKKYKRMVSGKTGALIYLSALMGSCPYAIDSDRKEHIRNFAHSLGYIHQIQDDLEDINSNVNIDRTLIAQLNSNETPKDTVSTYIKSKLEAAEQNYTENVAKLYQAGIVKSDILKQMCTPIISRNNLTLQEN